MISGIITTAADKIAVPGYSGSTEHIVPNRKGGADQDAAPVGDILKEAIFDTVTNPPINCPAIGQKWCLPGAMGDNVISRRISLRGIGRRPDGKTIITGAPGGAIRNDCALHPHTKVDAIRS